MCHSLCDRTVFFAAGWAGLFLALVRSAEADAARPIEPHAGYCAAEGQEIKKSPVLPGIFLEHEKYVRPIRLTGSIQQIQTQQRTQEDWYRYCNNRRKAEHHTGWSEQTLHQAEHHAKDHPGKDPLPHGHLAQRPEDERDGDQHQTYGCHRLQHLLPIGKTVITAAQTLLLKIVD